MRIVNLLLIFVVCFLLVMPFLSRTTVKNEYTLELQTNSMYPVLPIGYDIKNYQVVQLSPPIIKIVTDKPWETVNKDFSYANFCRVRLIQTIQLSPAKEDNEGFFLFLFLVD